MRVGRYSFFQTVGYCTQTSCILQVLLKPLHSNSSISFFIYLTCRILIRQSQRICMVHNQPLTGKDCLENGAQDTTQRAQQDLHQKWVLLLLRENIQLLHKNYSLSNDLIIKLQLNLFLGYKTHRLKKLKHLKGGVVREF